MMHVEDISKLIKLIHRIRDENNLSKIHRIQSAIREKKIDLYVLYVSDWYKLVFYFLSMLVEKINQLVEIGYAMDHRLLMIIATKERSLHLGSKEICSLPIDLNLDWIIVE